MQVIKPTSKKFQKLFTRTLRRNRRVEDTVRRVLEDVRTLGDEALVRYTRKFDKVKIAAKELKVTESEISGAYSNICPDFVASLKVAIENVTRYYKRQKKRSWKMTNEDGVILGEKIRPLESVGVYVPSGTVPLPSTVYMTVLPAKLACVEKVYLVTPP